MTWFEVATELMIHWSNPEGEPFAALLHNILPFYGNAMDSYEEHIGLSQ